MEIRFIKQNQEEKMFSLVDTIKYLQSVNATKATIEEVLNEIRKKLNEDGKSNTEYTDIQYPHICLTNGDEFFIASTYRNIFINKYIDHIKAVSTDLYRYYDKFKILEEGNNYYEKNLSLKEVYFINKDLNINSIRYISLNNDLYFSLESVKYFIEKNISINFSENYIFSFIKSKCNHTSKYNLVWEDSFLLFTPEVYFHYSISNLLCENISKKDKETLLQSGFLEIFELNSLEKIKKNNLEFFNLLQKVDFSLLEA